jgi:hypothetical protein
MADFEVTEDLLKHVSSIIKPHLWAIDDAVTEAYPDHRDAAYTLALAYALAILVETSEVSAKMAVVDNINAVMRNVGFALTPVT